MSDATKTEHESAVIDYLNELPSARPHIHETRKFPDGFLWGSATSAHQVEGGNVNNDWWEWEKVPGHIADGTVSGRACEQYERYEADFDLAKSLNQNAHRLSVEWSRIEPEEGRWDQNETLHYRKVLEALKARGMSVMLTAWHFTLPKWFAAKGGWESRDAVRHYERYVSFLAKEFGDLVDHWNTMNEPMVYLLQSYGSGIWPPGSRSPLRNIRVFGKLCMAHKAGYRAIHAQLDGKTGADGTSAEASAKEGSPRPVMVGIAQNVITFEPYRKQALVDNLFVWFADKMFNRQFFIWTKGTHDFIGINYYFHYRIKYVPTKVSELFYEVHTENREVSDLGWEINAAGIFDAIISMSRFKLPIIITEHGVANADDGKRPRVIVSALKEVYHAIQSGVDVRGYFHWSLIDNFEWERGFSGRFGLIAIDYHTMKRTPRRSAYVYADICKENGLPHTLLRFMGHGVRW
jgi:beta-glucosidase